MIVKAKYNMYSIYMLYIIGILKTNLNKGKTLWQHH